MARLALLLTAGLSAVAAADEPTPPVPPPIPLPRVSGAIVVDGDLSDPGWKGAAVVDTFFETVFGDNRAPGVTTVAWLAYNERYLYVAVRCDDPDPRKIRAPYVDRDQVIGTDDNVAIFLDTRNDRRSAQEFRVSPRGIQGDAVFNDASGTEDFSPDFYYDTAGRITDKGWQAELRIPLSSLRYPRADPQKWGIIIWRNYPRDFRYAIYSSPPPRGANCLVCLSRELTGLTGLPSASHFVAAPYASAQDVARADAPGRPLGHGRTDKRIGLDVKWSPSASTALDATINPDFSQVEADVAQIAVNNRFALFFPEKRPFFLEGVDLFDTPIPAAYTRTITSPRWGARSTGKFGASSYTLLVTQDRGGGSVILPGPTRSDFAPQDFSSVVGIARVRRDFGRSFLGLLYSGREDEGAGHNHVVGPDGQWRPNDKDVLAAQLLLSDTTAPDRPDVAPVWDGRRLTSHALETSWRHSTRGLDWNARYRDFGDGFRADQGFVPQVGYREGYLNPGYKFFPKGLFSFVGPFLNLEYAADRRGDLITRQVDPGVLLLGRRNLQANVQLQLRRERTADRTLSFARLSYLVQVDPSRRFTRVGASGLAGEDVDVLNVRVGRGVSVTAFATVRPTDHLTLDANSALSWLNVDRRVTASAAGAGSGRLFTAQIQRLKATYNFTPRIFLRLIGQYVSTRRDPSLYVVQVPRRSGAFSGSALFSYRLNWQTALFVGYGDERALDERERLARTERQLFVKLSYAFQR
jgi:Domain of unknown function (DUF5916)/Carbohydrate family 9 binding domain-like